MKPLKRFLSLGPRNTRLKPGENEMGLHPRESQNGFTAGENQTGLQPRENGYSQVRMKLGLQPRENEMGLHPRENENGFTAA
jgi:hypothetical protein